MNVTSFDLYSLIGFIIPIATIMLTANSEYASTEDSVLSGISIVIMVLCMAWITITMQIWSYKKSEAK